MMTKGHIHCKDKKEKDQSAHVRTLIKFSVKSKYLTFNFKRQEAPRRHTTLKQLLCNVDSKLKRRWLNVVSSLGDKLYITRPGTIPAGTQRWKDVNSTLIQHLNVESTLKRRCFNVVCSLGSLSSAPRTPKLTYICTFARIHTIQDRFLLYSTNVNIQVWKR